MPTVFAGLMCHAPIVLPEVAGAREARRCERTTRAMREVAERAAASAPDRLVLISPHSPRREVEWAAWTGRHRGSLAAFRAPDVQVDLPDAPEVAEALGLPGIDGARYELDHGAMVPLAFLWRAGWRGPTAILALPWEEPDSEAIGRALSALPGRTAVIASGDMSHRLQPGAPAGYHPSARRFDDAFVHALEREDWDAAVRAPHRADAAEDVVDSARVAMAAAGGPRNAEVLSYEGPWGVGYTEAVFFDPAPPLYAVARAAVQAMVHGRKYRPPADRLPSHGVFVTLHEHGELRGCIGHMAPVHDSLYDEVADVARASAGSDPRFPPVTADELANLHYEVSVLQPTERVGEVSAPGRAGDSLGPAEASLDAAIYGVEVTAGRRHGVLLPDIDGVDTPVQQVSIACRKAGIRPGERIVLSRFAVTKVEQP